MEYVGLHPKMYSILEAFGKNTKKAKDVKKDVVKKHIRHEQYKEALFESKLSPWHGCPAVRASLHLRATFDKVSLSLLDSKRWIANNEVDTLAYGHRDAVLAECCGVD